MRQAADMPWPPTAGVPYRVDDAMGGSEVEVCVAGHVDFHYELVYPDGRAVPVRRTWPGAWRDA